jgi:hypothetical protein
MKLEVGNYVRTIDGFLWKPKKIEIDEDGCYLFDDYYYFEPEQIYKSSNNIIDLIEVGDYVNGHLVTKISKDGFVWLEGYSVDGTWKYVDFINEWGDNIKSIVTSQQFESMQYKVD